MRVEVLGAKEVAAKIRAIDPKLAIFLKRRMDVASELLYERIIIDLVAGSWGIKSRRGTAGLAGTVHPILAEVKGAVVEGGVRGAGSPAEYGAYFQTGGRGPYTIVGSPILGWKAYGAFQQNIKQRAFAFTADMIFARRVNHPAIKHAPWMTGPFKDMEPQIVALLQPTDVQRELFE